MITSEGGVRGRLGVVVPAGGTSVRYGPADKLAADLGGRSLLDRSLDGLPAHAAVVCVGPEVPTDRTVTWVREDPAHGGPLAAVAAGVRALAGDTLVVVLVGGDMPRAGRVVPSLTYALAAARAADDRIAASVAADGSGTPQPLLAAWHRRTLLARLQALGDPTGRPLRDLLDAVPLVLLAVPGTATDDVDTPADLERLRPAPPGSPTDGGRRPEAAPGDEPTTR